jgi:virginiamycin A acetyltransferase
MKMAIKRIVQAVSLIIVSPLVLFYRALNITRQDDSLFVAIGQLLALIPGKTGSYLRVGFYSCTANRVSSDTHIDFGSYLSHQDVVLEDGVYIGAYCIIGKCHVGRGTLVGSFVNILSGRRQHSFRDSGDSRRIGAGEFAHVVVGSECWIGNNSVLMADVGERSVIGAASVVVKEVPAQSVAVGNPCRVVKTI